MPGGLQRLIHRELISNVPKSLSCAAQPLLPSFTAAFNAALNLSANQETMCSR
jgi:hypothetical protein